VTDDDWLFDTSVRQCPYCGEPVELESYEPDGPAQRTIQDCDVCCRPIEVLVEWDERGASHVTLRRQDE
jgi:hypothetical protein